MYFIYIYIYIYIHIFLCLLIALIINIFPPCLQNATEIENAFIYVTERSMQTLQLQLQLQLQLFNNTSSCFDNAVQSEEAGKNKAACMHLHDFQQCLCASRGKFFYIMVTMAIRQKTRYVYYIYIYIYIYTHISLFVNSSHY